MNRLERHNRLLLVILIVFALSSAYVAGSIVPRAFAVGQALFQYSDIFSAVLSHIYSDYVEEVPPKKLVLSAIQGMLKELDPHSNLLTPELAEELSERTNGQYSGIGIEFDIRDGYLVVLQPLEGGPSERVGIQPGDKIVKINGVSAIGITKEEVFKKLRGPKGTKVRVTVKREGVPEDLEFTIVRDRIEIKSVRAAFMLRNKYGYVRLANFNRNTAKDLRKALKKFDSEGIKGLVLDLRTNPGGLMDQAISVADMFLDKGKKIVYTKGRIKSANREYFSREPNPPRYPIIVMINEYSASASEIVAGALQDWDRALIVGRRSFGKGLVQSVYDIGYGYRLKLTTAAYYIPSGRSVQMPWKKKHGNEGENDSLSGNEESSQDTTTTEKNKTPYYTLLKKRIVYGGGGIQPDIELKPNPDLPKWLVETRRKGMFFDFITAYLVERNIHSFKQFKIDQGLLNEFRQYLSQKNISVSEDDFACNLKIVKTLLRAEAAGHISGLNDKLRVISDIDEELQEAVSYFPQAQALLMSDNVKISGD